MTDYGVDRARLEDLSTEEIQRILREERDDYTPEAIAVFQEILDSRGVDPSGSGLRLGSSGPIGATGSSPGLTPEMIRSPTDAIRVLNELLSGVLNGSVDPQVCQAATNVVMGILHAIEQEFMTGSREDS